MDENYENYNLTESEETLIFEQIKYLHGEFVSIQQVFVSVISVAIAVYAVIVYYALNSAKDEFFLFLPFLFSLSVYNILKYTIRVLGLDAYISHLEKLINVNHKKSLLLWQSYLSGANGYVTFGILPQLPCYVAMGIFLFNRFCLATSSTTYPPHIIFLLKILLLIQVAGLILMAINCTTQYWVVLKICKTMPPALLSKKDVQKIARIKPRQLYYTKLLSCLISKCVQQKRKEFPKKDKKDSI